PPRGSASASASSNWTASWQPSSKAMPSRRMPPSVSNSPPSAGTNACLSPRPASMPTPSPPTRSWQTIYDHSTATTPRAAPRWQALRWLHADLALYTKLAERKEPATKQALRQRLAHWQQDADLASLRDQAALDKLPDDERTEWRQLWAEVAALLKKVDEKK